MTYTDELDRVYVRVERSVDLSGVETKDDLRRAVESAGQSNGRWNSRLNSLVFDVLKSRREQGREYWINRAITATKSVVIGAVKDTVFKALYYKKDGSARFAATDKRTGRFTKIDRKQLNKVI